VSAIDDLIAQVSDPRLRERLAAEWASASKEKKFGLVFEDHLPERLPLPKARPRRGDLVCRRAGPLDDVWRVVRVREGIATCIRPGSEPHATPTNPPATETVDLAVDELLVVREFGEPTFPALVPMDAVQNSDPAAPWHVLIEADNYHALQLLDYLYAGRVDCIYIDPPYNTGALDWKYNNDYVDANDQWRHSKWLAMMQRRLRLARRLLNPADSVLICTIDEKEYLHLGMLLHQEFPDARIQMISSVISQKGSARSGEFSRCNEFIYFVQIGSAAPIPQKTDMLHSRHTKAGDEVEWGRLTRNGANGRRTARPNLFYPIFFNPDGTFHSVGDVLPPDQDRSSVVPPFNTVAVFPIATDGTEMTWALNKSKLEQYIRAGYVKFGALRPTAKQPVRIYYLTDGYVEAAKSGKIVRDQGSPVRWIHSDSKGMKPLTVWNMASHNAAEGGTNLVKLFLPDRRFPFPKSLYAVEDALRFFVANKPDALILDFFAGSGTTAHAVMRLNRQDGGRRRCILVTNNEVSADEQKALAAQGLQPGDEGWERWGICRHITFPRLKAAITGKTPEGEPIKGDYKFADEFPMREGFATNLAYFKLDFLDPERVSLRRAFREILPLLWLKAGAVGPRPELGRHEPEPALFAPEGSNFVVLLDETRMGRLLRALQDRAGLSHVFIVTDADESFKTMAQEVQDAAGKANPGLQVVQLYRDYLLNFMINQNQDQARTGTGAAATSGSARA